MTHPLQPSVGFESESLQADVMRFMAIIGFCLVAIFALVRNTDARSTAPGLETEAVVEETPAPPPAPLLQERRRPQPAVAQPMPEASPAPVPSPEPATIAAAPEPVALALEAAAPAMEAAAPAMEEPAPKSEQVAPSPNPSADATEEGLSLSFNSDRDFLSLISAGTVELFVVDPAAAEPTLRFDPSNDFIPAGAPGRIYELLPETIPVTITTALARRRVPSGVLTWGVKLPPALERDIAEQRERHSQGTLLINRHARIRHVPAA